MAEVLRTFDEPIYHSADAFRARVVGRLADDRMWEGWLEFTPIAQAGDVLVSPVESRQPERDYLEYWAQGLTVVYAEGSLDRALHPVIVHPRINERPASDKPASRTVARPPRVRGPEPVLDPFEIGSRSTDILAQELSALNRPRLVNLVLAYDLNPQRADVASMTDRQLIRFIVQAVERELSV